MINYHLKVLTWINTVPPIVWKVLTRNPAFMVLIERIKRREYFFELLKMIMCVLISMFLLIIGIIGWISIRLICRTAVLTVLLELRNQPSYNSWKMGIWRSVSFSLFCKRFSNDNWQFIRSWWYLQKILRKYWQNIMQLDLNLLMCLYACWMQHHFWRQHNHICFYSLKTAFRISVISLGVVLQQPPNHLKPISFHSGIKSTIICLKYNNY